MRSTPLIEAEQFSVDCICLNTQRAARSIARQYDAAFRELGITSGQFSILAALNQLRPIALSDLAQTLGMERTTLTRNLTPLEIAGFLQSAAGEGDRRLRVLSLTQQGRAKLEAAMPLWSRAQAIVNARLISGQWPALQTVLAQLARE